MEYEDNSVRKMKNGHLINCKMHNHRRNARRRWTFLSFTLADFRNENRNPKFPDFSLISSIPFPEISLISLISLSSDHLELYMYYLLWYSIFDMSVYQDSQIGQAEEKHKA